jgi:hypothetical protein
MRTYTCIRLSNDKTKNQSWMECDANHCLFRILISWLVCSLHQWSECQTTNNYVDVFPMLAVTLIPNQNIKLVTRVYWSTDNYSGGDWWCVPISQEGRTVLGRLKTKIPVLSDAFIKPQCSQPHHTLKCMPPLMHLETVWANSTVLVTLSPNDAFIFMQIPRPDSQRTPKRPPPTRHLPVLHSHLCSGMVEYCSVFKPWALSYTTHLRNKNASLFWVFISFSPTHILLVTEH